MLSFSSPVFKARAISLLTLLVGLFATGLTGCGRAFFRRTADREAYHILSEKGAGPSWYIQPGFTIEPDPRSRFKDPTCYVDPRLPVPAPELYGYQIPLLATPEPPARELGSTQTGFSELPVGQLPVEAEDPEITPELPPDLLPDGAQQIPSEVEPGDVGSGDAKPGDMESDSSSLKLGAVLGRTRVASLPPPSKQQARVANLRSLASNDNSQVQQAALVRSIAPPDEMPDSAVVTASTASPLIELANPLDLTHPLIPSGDEESGDAEEISAVEVLGEFGQDFVIRIPPLPQDAWEALPDACLRRMLEFESVRQEFERSFKAAVTEAQLDSAARVNLENILELALINSRDYQTRKEALYRTALTLSLRRFDYDLKFLRTGNGVDTRYTHNRTGGIEVNTLRTPTNLGINKSLYSAGELVARFANDVVLTFNGTSGYSSSVGSEILIDLVQPIIQRDVRFEPLTQAERDVVYAARDFVQFRKQLFRNLADQYYSLLLTYRGIEINTLDYFSNLDGFNRSSAYYRAGDIPLFQVDQFEQRVLASRSNLISSCNNLERALDRLKLQVGLPPELPMNLDLSELESLTRADEATVVREQIRRSRKYVRQQLELGEATVAIPATLELARRMHSLTLLNELQDANRNANAETTAELTQENGVKSSDELALLVALLEAADKRLEAAQNARGLEQKPSGERELLPAQILLRTKDVVESTLDSIQQELLLLQLADGIAHGNLGQGEESEDSSSRSQELDQEAQNATLARQVFEDEWTRTVNRFRDLGVEQAQMPNAQRSLELPRLISEVQDMLNDGRALEGRITDVLANRGFELRKNDRELLELSQAIVEQSSMGQFAGLIGLKPLDVDMDEAMLSALVSRLDLMNRRGELADTWRDIKYAGDDLKSVLNLRATQSIRTRLGSNNPFDFTFDDSTTNLSMDFDSPLNRRVERNTFRLALINYNVALRNLIAAEDNVKLDIRDDLRALELDQNQYEISIASAALAYERVASTRMQLATGQRNVSARDFLEAQQAYTQSLSSVAQRHIGYILDRIQFFLDLEQLQVDPMNFWPELRNEEYPFLPNLDFGGTNPYGYGRLPYGPWYSDCLRRMEQVPPGEALIRPSGNPSLIETHGEPQ